MIPPTFWQGRYPFYQARLLGDPDVDTLGHIIFEYNGRNQALYDINDNEDYQKEIKIA